MGWNYLSIPKLQRLHRWSLGMDKLFHPIHYNVYNYLSMLGLPNCHDMCSTVWIIKILITTKRMFERFNDHHDDVIKWKHFPRYWPFVRGIHRSPVNSPHKGQWRGALMFTLICTRINGWVNTIEAGDLRRYLPHYGVIVMWRLCELHLPTCIAKYSTSYLHTVTCQQRPLSIELKGIINLQEH